MALSLPLHRGNSSVVSGAIYAGTQKGKIGQEQLSIVSGKNETV
jgi:hypothetical protein